MRLESFKRKVRDKFGADEFDDLLHFLDERDPIIWGQEKPENFLELNLYCLLYHDLFGVGFNRVFAKVNWGFRWSRKSLQHNARVLRHHGKAWGQSKIGGEYYSNWNLDNPLGHVVEFLRHVNLWMDLSDVPISSKYGSRRGRVNWS